MFFQCPKTKTYKKLYRTKFVKRAQDWCICLDIFLEQVTTKWRSNNFFHFGHEKYFGYSFFFFFTFKIFKNSLFPSKVLPIYNLGVCNLDLR